MGLILPLKRDAATNLVAEPQAGDNGLVIGHATLDASGLTTARTLTLPDVSAALLASTLVTKILPSGTYVPSAADAGLLLRVPNATVIDMTSYVPATGLLLVIANENSTSLAITPPGGVDVGWPVNSATTFYLAPQSIGVMSLSGAWLKLLGNFMAAINAQTGTTYSLNSGDVGGAGTIHTNAAAVTVTVTTTTGTYGNAIIPVRQGGAGAVTIVAGSGVTINAPNGNTTKGLGDMRLLEQQPGTDVWNLY